MFFSERDQERDTLTRVVWTLIDNGKLANQIARLVSIALKKRNYVL